MDEQTMKTSYTPAPPAQADQRKRADYTQIGLTDSLCPQCMEVVKAKIIVRGKRVYFRKRCPTHGVREDFVCSDVAWWDRDEGNTAAVLPRINSTDVRRGCPYDCGICPDHEQHTCIGLVEVTSKCNLSCPMCFASSGPSGNHLTLEEVERCLDLLVKAEGRAEVCQLSGGEPTLHPQFAAILEAALARPIDYVMVNTNGLRIAKDDDLVELLARHHERVEVYLQWDGEDEATVKRLRGEAVIETKRRALDRLQQAGVHVTLVATLHGPVVDDFYQKLWDIALGHSNVVGISLQPATYSGRHLLPEDLENRVTYPDVIEGLAKASGGQVATTDFAPLPCAHPNCHQIMLAARDGKELAPLARFGDITRNLDLLAGGISFTRERSRQLIDAFMARRSGCGSDCGCHADDLAMTQIGSSAQVNQAPRADATAAQEALLARFAGRVLAQQAGANELMRVTITSFLDAYNFDVRQLMKCCTHHVLPSGHIIPFCAYNSLYRPGHLPLPPLSQ